MFICGCGLFVCLLWLLVGCLWVWCCNLVFVLFAVFDSFSICGVYSSVVDCCDAI